MRTKKPAKTIGCTLALLLLAPITSAEMISLPGEEDSEIRAARSNIQTLNDLLNSEGGLVSSSANCGTPGECNWVTCPEPDCRPGQTAECTCSVAGKCGLPWDKIPTYNCKCGCYGNPDPEPQDPKEPEPLLCTPTSPKVCVYPSRDLGLL